MVISTGKSNIDTITIPFPLPRNLGRYSWTKDKGNFITICMESAALLGKFFPHIRLDWWVDMKEQESSTCCTFTPSYPCLSIEHWIQFDMPKLNKMEHTFS